MWIDAYLVVVVVVVLCKGLIEHCGRLVDLMLLVCCFLQMFFFLLLACVCMS